MEAHEDPYPRTTTVPWDKVANERGRPAWTVGQLRAALTGLADNVPLTLRGGIDEDGIYCDQIVTDAGFDRYLG